MTPALDTARARNLATVSNSLPNSEARIGTRPLAAPTDGSGRGFLVGAGFAVAGAILTPVLISSRDSRRHVEAAQAAEAPAAA